MSGQQDALIAVGDDEKNDQWLKIIIRSDDGSMKWVSFNPDSAVDFAEAVAKKAYHKKYGKPSQNVVTLRDEIIQRKRDTLIQRGTIVIPQLLAQGKSNEHIMATLVDMVLAEVA